MGKDPYVVLGVSPSSSDDEIKKAYRDLARKYHPDNFNDNALSELAEEKMKEINEAYDTVTNQRQNGGQAAYQQQSYGRTYSGTNAELYQRVRSLISSGNIAGAESVLNSVAQKDAEWYFLMGSCVYGKGWYDEARQYFMRAAQMDPTNPEYINAVNRMNSTNTTYRTVNTVHNRGCTGCDMCSNLICADCCCECMGGDLIPCC